MQPDDETVGEIAARVVHSVGELANLHIEVAKAELTRDAKALVADLAPLVLAAPLLLIGYLAVCIATGIGIATWIGYPAGCGLVGLVNLGIGGLALRYSLVHLRARGAGPSPAVGQPVEVTVGP